MATSTRAAVAGAACILLRSTKMAMRTLLTVVRVLGVLAVVVVLYVWLHPGSLARWAGPPVAASASARAPSPPAGPVAPAPATAAATPAASAAMGAGAMPAAAIVPAPRKVTAPESAVARWVGAKYGVAPDAIAPLVAEADVLTRTYHLSPNLLIAVMAIESNFHPYIQSQAGAQGLMQVMPKIHSKRYEKFGGKTAFLDPLVSLRVGAEILRDCIKTNGGTEAEGLRFYFGGGPASDMYIDKVRAEQHRLNRVASGAHVGTTD
jgi:hypothetical protein